MGKFYAKEGKLPSYERSSMITSKVMENGSTIKKLPSALQSADYARKRLGELSGKIKDLNEPGSYQTALYEKLLSTMKEEIANQKDIHL